jgi:hypothetical protein
MQSEKLLAYLPKDEKGDSPIERVELLWKDISQQLDSCITESNRLQHDINALFKIHDGVKEQGLDSQLKEKAAELKSLILSLVDQKRSQLQILFINKIQPLFQKKTELAERRTVWKKILKDNIRLHSTIVGHAAGRSKDITGGLARVAELFEGHQKEGDAKIAPIDGRVDFRY